MAALDDSAIIVGHSIGATILINALAELKRMQIIAGVFLKCAAESRLGRTLERPNPRSVFILDLSPSWEGAMDHLSPGRASPDEMALGAMAAVALIAAIASLGVLNFLLLIAPREY